MILAFLIHRLYLQHHFVGNFGKLGTTMMALVLNFHDFSGDDFCFNDTVFHIQCNICNLLHLILFMHGMFYDIPLSGSRMAKTIYMSTQCFFIQMPLLINGPFVVNSILLHSSLCIC
ncbi:unnamed protein product [Prunus brigantina]